MVRIHQEKEHAVSHEEEELHLFLTGARREIFSVLSSREDWGWVSKTDSRGNRTVGFSKSLKTLQKDFKLQVPGNNGASAIMLNYAYIPIRYDTQNLTRKDKVTKVVDRVNHGVYKARGVTVQKNWVNQPDPDISSQDKPMVWTDWF